MSIPPWRANNPTPRPAFTSVSSSQTLSRGNSNSSTSTSGGNSSGSGDQAQQWPDALKEFVSKCFTEVHPDDKEIMETQLKEMITKAFETKRTWSIDWKSMWVPIMLERRHREQGLSKRQQIKKRGLAEFRDEANGSRREMERSTSADVQRERVVSGGVGGQQNNNRSGKTVAQIVNNINNNTSLDEDYASDERREKRLKRFITRDSPTPASTVAITPTSLNEPVVGRATNLEKRYLRLTSAPDPELVRPLHILRQTLELLKRKWRDEQNYPYICDQFKSLRQDLTVQHIENEFTVECYEIHARIALEKNDLGEYNQCQSRLKELYSKGIAGNEKEFIAYRILYLLHTQNRSEIGYLLTNLITDDTLLRDKGISHALLVDKAMTRKNYHQLFRLYAEAPKMGGYVMDSFIHRERLSALSTICLAYKPDISVEFLTNELGFLNEEECLEFLKDQSIIEFLKQDQKKLITKDSYAKIEIARQQAYKKVDIKGQI